MIFRTEKEEIKKYRDSPVLSQSKLKKLLIGVEEFLEEDSNRMTLPMIIGSAVDAILTGYEGQFEEQFHVACVPKPSEAIEAILLYVYENTLNKENSLEAERDLIEEAVQVLNYQSNWKIDTRINKILEQSFYYDEIKVSYGKIILSLENKNTIDNIVDELLISSVTKDYFRGKPEWDIYFQYPIFWKTRGVEKKGLIDILVAVKDNDNEVKELIIIDLKTTSGKTMDFISSARKFRYDIQAAWYKEGIEMCIEEGRLPFYIEKSIPVEFIFLVASTAPPICPAIFKTTKDFLEVGMYGLFSVVVNGREIRESVIGIEELIDLFLYHQQKGWDQDKALKESNGVFEIDWDYISYTKVSNEGEIWEKV